MEKGLEKDDPLRSPVLSHLYSVAESLEKAMLEKIDVKIGAVDSKLGALIEVQTAPKSPFLSEVHATQRHS